MKILLLGDYSSVNKNLKDGLKSLGHNVTLASNGDSWKKIPGADEVLFINKDKTIYDKVVERTIKPIFDNRFSGYDIAQAINPTIFNWTCGTIPFRKIIKNNKKFFVNGAGLDSYVYDAWKNKKYSIPYYAFDDKSQKIMEKYEGKKIRSKVIIHTCEYVIKHARGVIPCVPYEYELPYEGIPNLLAPILFPVNVGSIPYEENTLKEKIVFFHGVTRRSEKGSDYIEQAMKKIQNRYPNDVECIVSERMNYTEYLDTIKRTNVIIDQCRSFGYGMNACISLGMGKIVFSGAEKEVLLRMGKAGEECPIVNIVPDASQIYDEMCMIIENKRKIRDMGESSRRYIEKYHDHISVAKQYIDAWNNN